MEQQRGIARFAPLAGILFTLIVIVGIVLEGGDGPDAKDSAAKVVKFYTDNDTKQIVSSIMEVYAAFLLVWFAGSLRERISRAEPGASRLASISFAGAVITAVGLAVDGAIEFATADSAGDISPEATQALNALYNDFFFPLVLGVALMTIAAGLAAVRYGAFNKVLGWIAIVLGVISLTPIGFVGAGLTVLWVGAMGIVLFLSQNAAGAGAAGPGAGAAGPGAPPPAAPEAPVAPA
jgi:hypothetical protein